METRANAALNAEATERDQRICLGVRLAVHDDAPARVDVGELRLEGIEAVRRPHAEANIALEVARVILGGLLARAVLWEVLGRAHDKLELVGGLRQCLRVYPPAEEAVRGREEDEGLVVERGVHHLLQLNGELFQRRGAIGAAWRV